MYKIIEYFSDGFEVYEMSIDLAVYVYGQRLWQEMLSGKWSHLYSVEPIK